VEGQRDCVESTRTWYIKDSGFLERVDPHDREVFLNTCPERSFEPGQVIFRIGDPAVSLHIIALGKVKLVRPTAEGRERIVAICGPDDFIGEAFLRDADTYRVEAVAMTPVMTCPISRQQFKQVAARAPGFVLSFAEVLASHLHYCRDKLSLSYDPVKIRVVKILLEQAEQYGRPLGDGDWCLLETELKHDDIASLCSATRVAITMAITELRRDGMVQGSRGRYELNVQRLSGLAGALAES
jgi:CRP-like cAMP-binding protein